MAQTSVAQFASELKVPPSVLLEQLRAAGVEKRVPEDSLTEQDKSRLLEYLRKSHGSAEAKNKITLTHGHFCCLNISPDTQSPFLLLFRFNRITDGIYDELPFILFIVLPAAF